MKTPDLDKSLNTKSLTKKIKELSTFQILVIGATATGIITLFLSFIFLFGTETFQITIIISTLVAGSPYSMYRYWMYRRKRKIEKYLPDYLRDVSESLRAGMALPKAIESASRGSYGPLSDEMEKTAAQISWGIPFNEAMQKFADRSNSDVVNRAITIVVESHRSGGDIAEVLETVSKDMRALRRLRTQRKSKLRVYLVSIYFIFFLFLGIIVALVVSFVPATPDLNKAASVVGGSPSDMSPRDFKNLFFHLSLIEALFAGLIAGQMGSGRVLAGVKHSIILIVTTLLVFQFFLVSPRFKDTVSNEILKIPTNTQQMESSEAVLTIQHTVTTEEIAQLVREKAEQEGKESHQQIKGEDLLFKPLSCEPCTRGDLEVSGNQIKVNKISDVRVKVKGEGEGQYTIILGGESGGQGEGSAEALRGGQ